MIVCLVQTPTAILHINYKSTKLEGKVRILHDGRGSVVKWEHGSIKMFLVYHQEQPHRRVESGKKEQTANLQVRLQAQVRFLSLLFPERDSARSTVGSAILIC